LSLGTDTNTLGLLYTTDAAIQVMKEQGAGHLVNVSSVAGRKSGLFRGAYSGTKLAVNAISKALWVELLEDNIRVAMVEPSAVETELADPITDEEPTRRHKRSLPARHLQPEDIASAIAYCVSQPERVSVNEILIRLTQQANEPPESTG
jgi:NADP-dependent 3-hydroxy acid dehydrogenase YdfG